MDSLGTKSDEEVSFSRREDGAQARPSFFFCPPLVLGKQKMQVTAQLAGLSKPRQKMPQARGREAGERIDQKMF